MAAYLIKNRIRSLADLKGFQTSGYYYSDKDSSDTKPVFLRDEVTRANSDLAKTSFPSRRLLFSDSLLGKNSFKRKEEKYCQYATNGQRD